MMSEITPPTHRYAFTVFTATYNRAHTLGRVYESLGRQTFRDFEWLVVDDGSTDKTREFVSDWQKESHFPIRYYYQQNSGKHVAFNRAVQMAEGGLFLNADSDDAFATNALERFYYHWMSIPGHKRDQFTGVTALCMDMSGNRIGDRFPFDPTDSDSEEIYFRFHVKGEKWGFHRTDLLKQFPFPEIPGIKFVSESYVWNRIAKQYKTRFVNEKLRIYHQDAQQQLTRRTVQAIAPARIFYADTLNLSIIWFRYSPLLFLKIAALYARYATVAGDPLHVQIKRLNNLKARLLWAIGLPVGYGVAFMDRLRGKKGEA